MRAKDRTGLLGEDRAAEYLSGRGHSVLARRWRSRTGELDLVTRDGDELVAVEVKTRRGTGYGHPFEAVTAQKLRRLHKLLAEFASGQAHWPAARRVDVVSVLMLRQPGTGPRAFIEHLKDV